VIAGDPDGSFLVWKLEGVDDTGAMLPAGCLRMPFGGVPTSPDDIANVRAWIMAGAMEN
jgi:hypothetical protein